MTLFYVSCAILILLGALFVLLPIRVRNDDDQLAKANLRWYELRASELERDGDEALRDDIQLRLVEDEAERSNAPLTDVPQQTSTNFPRWALLLVITLASVGVYGILGAAPDVLITQRLQAFGEESSAEDVQQLMDDIQSRSERRPENLHYMALLGRYHMGGDDFASAQDVYERLLEQVPEDAQALAFAAQAEYLAQGRQLTDRARLRAEQSLAADPRQRTALSMLGMASFEQGEFRGAIAYWQRLLATEPPNSEGARMIAQVIATARQNLAGESMEAASAAPAATTATTGKGVTVRVELPEGVTLAPTETVFVLARNAQSESRMPIAVERFTASQLPVTVRLDDTRSMAGQKLSETESIIVAVQVSPQGRPGEANASWLGQAGPIAPTNSTDPLLISLAPNSPSQ